MRKTSRSTSVTGANNIKPRVFWPLEENILGASSGGGTVTSTGTSYEPL
jgi:hypothetical protein